MMAWMACFKWLCFRWFLYGFVCGFVWLWLLGEGGEGMSAFHLYQYMPFRPARGIQRIMVHPVCYWNRVFLYGYGFFIIFLGFVWLWLLGEGGEGMSALHLYQYMPFRPARGIQRIMVHPVCYWNRLFLFFYQLNKTLYRDMGDVIVFTEWGRG